MSHSLSEAFWAYERALMSNDVAELDRLFAPGPTTLRGDANGLLVGHDQISALRSSHTVGADTKPWRQILQTHVQAIDADHALIVAVTALASGGRGQETQLWARLDGEWKVTAAHVSAPAPALDTTVWRAVGDPLATPLGAGVLSGQTLAVAEPCPHIAGPYPAHAERLRQHGASVRGVALSNAVATAVSLGHASIGLYGESGATLAPVADVWSFRPTPRFTDTNGWATRDPELLARVGSVLVTGPQSPSHCEVVVIADAMSARGTDAAATVQGWLDSLGRPVHTLPSMAGLDRALAQGQIVIAPHPEVTLARHQELPLVVVPLLARGGVPCAVGLTAAPGRDSELLALASALAI